MNNNPPIRQRSPCPVCHTEDAIAIPLTEDGSMLAKDPLTPMFALYLEKDDPAAHCALAMYALAIAATKPQTAQHIMELLEQAGAVTIALPSDLHPDKAKGANNP